MLDLLDVIGRYNSAKAQEDDMIKDIELQKIQAEFLANNEMLAQHAEEIERKDEELAQLRLDVERLRDNNAQLRVQLGTKMDGDDSKDDEDDSKEDDKPIVYESYSDLATNF